MEQRRLVEFSPRAAREIQRARQWWHENRQKAPDAIDEELTELTELTELIGRLEAGAEHVGTLVRNIPGVRRVLLPRIRYYAYFRIGSATSRVQVAALWHASRGHEPQIE